MSPQAPIGVFDSGLGGLSVLREIRRLLPGEDLLYIADSAYVPYGDKPERVIQERSLVLTRFLLDRGAKAIVVACNTATAAAVTVLRQKFPTAPIVAMEPALKPAAAATRTGTVGVLATVGTLSSARFAALLSRYAGTVRILTQPCPGLVEQVEAGELESPQTRELLQLYTQPLLAAGADTLILGCTHYPFLRPLVEELAGPSVSIIDTGPAVARQLQRVLVQQELLRTNQDRGSHAFWSTGSSKQLHQAAETLWGQALAIEPLPADQVCSDSAPLDLNAEAVEPR